MKITLLLLTFLLTSCWIPFIWGDDEASWNDASPEVTSSTKTFQTSSISLTVPSNWDEINSSSLPSPKTWTIVTALKSSDTVDDIYRSLILLEDTIIGKLSSEQYAKSDYNVSIKNYSGHRLLEEKNIDFTDGISSLLYTFEAKYNPDSPRMKFIQSSKICTEADKNKVYNITIALPPSINDTLKYETLIKSLSCKTSEDTDDS